MRSFASFVLLAVLASPVLAQTPTVSLLIDNGFPSSGTLSIRSVLNSVATRKGQTFHFGSTWDTSYSSAEASWMTNVYNTFFNHMVAENGCKWSATEPTRGVSSLTQCLGVQSYAVARNASFRGHNTFWHEQLPSWLPGSVTASDLVTNVIPQHVQQEIQGMGAGVTSWDVVNEIVGDGVSNGMCVQNKNDWPTKTADGSGTNLVTDLSFLHAAFTAALQYAPSTTRFSVNDYNTSGNDAKTACMFALLADINANSAVPYNRLAVGFQSHITAAPGQFTAKSDLANTFAKLAALGATGMITEMDVKLSDTSSASERYQAAIWGDYIDACLYASNCFEFINWDPRDDLSWLGASGAGTLFDTNGNPKPAAYEVAARLQRYASGATELCATALGTSQCTVPAGSGSSTSTGSTTSASTSTSSATTTTTPTGPTGCASPMWGQCGGIGWAGCTGCSSGTCQVANAYYSQCL
ncbi:glycoside hydrolase superfamily [Mycena rosella]|uniref:Beta-xylanase n=1 Tax=Mycena rosella TaxID=1033263 RepID=A0AAD7DQ27_MYCRO|nr:glycoside hydrolase superfamily [Mycena rosella]